MSIGSCSDDKDEGKDSGRISVKRSTAFIVTVYKQPGAIIHVEGLFPWGGVEFERVDQLSVVRLDPTPYRLATRVDAWLAMS